jgi:hypothetical protein
MCHLAASDTLLRWYRRLVCWHWAYPRRSGRLSVEARLTALIEQMRGRTRAGVQRIQGELLRLIQKAPVHRL